MANNPKFSKTNIAEDYRNKYGWEMPTLKLARIMYNDNPLLFNSAERARDTLRAIEGKQGGRGNKIRKVVEERPRNPYNLPQSEEHLYEAFELNAKRIFILSDIHIPYHSIDALSSAFDYAKKEKPDAILLNGDTLDFFSLSRFVKDPKARSFAQELNAFREFMDVLKKVFNAKIYFKVGNHEERYFHYLWMKAGELHGVEEFELENIIKSRAEGIEIIKDKRIIKAGHLNIVHGHEFGGSVFSPVNIARGLFLRGKVSALQGHNHCTSSHVERDMNGGVVKTWSLGCLSELNTAYLPINKWNHGFAIVDMDGENFDVRNYTINKGKIS